MRSLDFSQTMFLIQTVQVGIGLLNLPRVIVEAAGHSGWQGIILAGFLVQIAIWIMVVLLRRFENLDIYEIARRVLGKWVGNLLGLLFAFYCVFATGLVARSYIEVVQSWLFPTTSTPVFFLLFLIPCLYCATGGARVLGRFAVVTFFATAWMLILMFAPAREVQLDYYLPLFDAPIDKLMAATTKVSASVIGFEMLLVVFPFVQRKDKVLLASSIGIWITQVIYLMVTLVAIGFYGEKFIEHLISPTLHMFKIVQLPMIERMEQIGIATWSFLIVNTTGTYLWAAGRYLHTLTAWKERTCIYLFVPFVIGIGLFPRNMFLLDEFEGYLSLAGYFFAGLLPVLLLLLALIFKKKGGVKEDSSPQEEKEESTAS